MTTVIDHHVDQLVDSLKALEALMMQPESLHLLSTHQAMERLHAALPLLSNANIAFAHLCERDGAGRLVGANHPVEYLTKQLGLPRADAFSLLNQAKTMFGEVEVPTPPSDPLMDEEEREKQAEEEERRKEEARKALVDEVKPAYERILALAAEELPKAAANPTGVGQTHPNGAAYYAYQLRENTSTDMTADQIHELGLSEVARLRGELEAVQKQIGFEGDLQAFFKHVQADPKRLYPNTDAGRQAYIDDATKAIDNIKQHLPAYFGLLPKADLVVRRVEAFREQDGAAQHYFPGTPDGARPGIYYAHLSDMDAMPKTELEVIAYHEGLPGHHMQISIAQELTGVPTFRTQTFDTAYNEGWGLYSEWLAKEMPDTYQDPYSEYGRLMSEMWRAIRLVVDTGMHAKGWSRDRAIAYLTDHTALSKREVTTEIDRYIGWPGQAGQLSPAAWSQTVKTKSILGAPGTANSSHDFDRSPSVR